MAYHILVVDDEEDILALLRDLFTMKGYQVLTAATGEQALLSPEEAQARIAAQAAAGWTLPPIVEK